MYISIGGQILSARNLIFENFNVKVPYDCYLPCVKDGASYDEIRNIFIDQTYDYLKTRSHVFDNMSQMQAKNKISDAISTKENKKEPNHPYIIFPSKPQIISDMHSLNKIDILEIPKILGNCATTCFAHPYTLKLHKKTKIAVKDFLGVDISILPQSVQNRINKKLNDPNELRNGMFSSDDIMSGEECKGCSIIGDDCSLVIFQILYNNLLKKGVRIDGFEITHHLESKHKIEDVLKIAMDKYNFALSFGTDDHFNSGDKYYFTDQQIQTNDKRKSYFDYHKMLCTNSSYFVLNRSGKEKLSKQENTFNLKFTL